VRENKTNFEQVPIAIVMEIVEAQIRHDLAAAADQKIQTQASDDFGLLVKKKSDPRAPSLSTEAGKLT